MFAKICIIRPNYQTGIATKSSYYMQLFTNSNYRLITTIVIFLGTRELPRQVTIFIVCLGKKKMPRQFYVLYLKFTNYMSVRFFSLYINHFDVVMIRHGHHVPSQCPKQRTSPPGNTKNGY